MCLKTVLGQTYDNIEVLIIDDGSTDSSYDICRKYSKVDSRIKLFQQKNGGVSSARNKGLLHCSGDFIGFIDPDDTIELNMYEVLLDQFDNNDIDIAVCSYSIVYRDKLGKLKEKKVFQEFEGISEKNEAIYQIQLNTGYKGYLVNKLFRRKCIFNENNSLKFAFNTDLIIMEDHIFVTNVFKECNKVKFINVSLYKYLMRPGSATKTNKIRDKINSYEILYEMLKDKNKKIQNIILWDLYTAYVNELAYYYIESNTKYTKNIDKINVLKFRFLKSHMIFKLGYIRKVLIEQAVKINVSSRIVEIIWRM